MSVDEEDPALRSFTLPKPVLVILSLFLLMRCGYVAAAQEEAAALDKSIKLFEQGDYLAAQSALLAIDRDKLGPREQSIRDDYVNRIQVALQMSEKALRDLEDAETAAASNEVGKASKLAQGVIDNEYAPVPVRKKAADLQKSMSQKGADAARSHAVASATPQGQAAPEGTAPPSTNTERARALTREADDMMRAGRYDEADRLYGEAMKAVPGYPEAMAGQQQVQQHRVNVAPPPGDTLIERMQREDQIRWQRTVADYRDVEGQIRDLVAKEQFEQANALLVRARQVVEAGKQFANPESLYGTLRNEVEVLAQNVANEERAYNERQVAQVRRSIEEQRAERLRQDEENRRRQVESLMEQAYEHRKNGDLDAAIAVLKQVTVIDPKYRPARWMLDDVEDRRQYMHNREVRQEFYEQSREALIQVEEAKIPWHAELTFPKNWLEIISGPERGRPGDNRAKDSLLSQLEKKVPVDFRHEPLDHVIERVADSQHMNIIVNWNDLDRAGVERATPIDLNLPNEISLQRAIMEILDQAGGGAAKLGFDVVEGNLKIATRRTLDHETYAAVYDINDLLMEIPNFTEPPMTDLKQSDRPGPFTGRKIEPKKKSLPWHEGEEADDEPTEDPGRTARVRKIINIIEDTVAPDSWRDRGGSVGDIKEINGQLVITQNSSAQRQIGDLLGKLRAQRAVQISVEARFVTVSSHYLEELGVDLDLVLNAGNAGYDYIPGANGGIATDPTTGGALLLPRRFSRLGFGPATPALGNPLLPNPNPVPQPYGQPFMVPAAAGGSGSHMTPVPIRNNVTSFTDPANLGSDVPGSFAGNTIGPALNIFGSFLDNIQADFLIRATQADSRTSVLTAPQLVLFNGQRSWVAVTIQQNFVSALNPVVAQGAVAQAPQIGTIDSGAVLDVNATVTSDKRYVTMTVRPGVTRLLGLQTIPFTGIAAGGGFGIGGALPALDRKSVV